MAKILRAASKKKMTVNVRLKEFKVMLKREMPSLSE